MSMSTLDERDLESLRYGWGSAYLIEHPEPGTWLAVRRDDHTTLRADNPVALRDAIMADYAARPVPRDDGPAQ
jgi:hypothetical protein